MNLEIVPKLLKSCHKSRVPYSGENRLVVSGFILPPDYHQLICISDGFITRRRFYRVFGFSGESDMPSISTWNSSEWKSAYGEIAKNLIFFAEDIFGDQYGYRFRASDSELVKFFVEGGKVELVHGGIDELIRAFITPQKSSLIDYSLAEKAFCVGKHPTAGQHLAFRLPLITGGDYTVENLHVESVEMHLGLLAQMSVKNLQLPDGTQIRRFV